MFPPRKGHTPLSYSVTEAHIPVSSFPKLPARRAMPWQRSGSAEKRSDPEIKMLIVGTGRGELNGSGSGGVEESVAPPHYDRKGQLHATAHLHALASSLLRPPAAGASAATAGRQTA